MLEGIHTHALQCTGEAVEGRWWRPECKGFAPKISPLVEAFIEVTGTHDAENCTVDCWSEPPENVPCQRDEGTYTNVISYLHILAMCQPSRKAWDKLVWPPQCPPLHACHPSLSTLASYKATQWRWV